MINWNIGGSRGGGGGGGGAFQAYAPPFLGPDLIVIP